MSRPQPIAYSYLRFSSPEQAKGDSVRRQEKLRDDWLARNPDVRLDTSVSLADKGVSGFTGKHRDNPDRHALAAFLRLVEQGRIPSGSFLLVENLDRLSREHIQPALMLFLGLLQAGVRVVQLSPVEQVFTSKSEAMVIMQAIMELSRGNSESRMKSERIGAAWVRKREAARTGQATEQTLPVWLEFRDGVIAVRDGAAETVRQIFKHAKDSMGARQIARRLTADGVPPLGVREKYTDDDGRKRYRGIKGQPYGKGLWDGSVVLNILRSRAVLGEYQPCLGRRGSRKQDRKPAGPPIPGYYPRIIADDDWYAVQAGLASRRDGTGRGIGGRAAAGGFVNPFGGLLHHPDGATVFCENVYEKRDDKGGPRVHRVLAKDRVSFPYATFERAVLTALKEVKPHSVLADDGSADRVAALTGRRVGLEGKIAKLTAALEAEDGEVVAAVAVLGKLEKELATVNDALADAQQQAATTASEAWGELPKLVDAVDAPDGRLRLRAVLRRVVEDVRCVFSRRGEVRLAAVQIWFAGGERFRLVYIMHRPPSGRHPTQRKPGRWWATSYRYRPVAASRGMPATLDLREPKQTEQVEQVLLTYDPEGCPEDYPENTFSGELP